MQKFRPILIIGIVLAVTIVGLFFLLRARPKQDFDATKTQPGTEVRNKTPEAIVVTLEEFGDYQCPPCGELHPSLKKNEAGVWPKSQLRFPKSTAYHAAQERACRSASC